MVEGNIKRKKKERKGREKNTLLRWNQDSKKMDDEEGCYRAPLLERMDTPWRERHEGKRPFNNAD